MAWFALRVHSTKERRVTQELCEKGIRAVFAGNRKQHKQGGRNATRNVHRVYCEIPGWVFADLTPEQFSQGRLSLGSGWIRDILGFDSGYKRARLPESWINSENIKEARFGDDRSEEVLFLSKAQKKSALTFIMGELVKVCAGPLDGHEGIVRHSTPKSTVISHPSFERVTLATVNLRKVG